MHIPFVRRTRDAADGPATDGPARDGDPSSDMPAVEPVLVYGAAWCGDCHTVTRYLDRQRVPYRWVDLGVDTAAQERIKADGYRAIPVVVLPDGRTLVEPSIHQLGDALGMAAG